MNRVQWSLEQRGRQVEGPVLRPLIAFGAMVVGCLGAFVTIGLAAIVIGLSLPLHLVLRVLGRKGFLTTSERRRFRYAVDLEGFRKAP